MSAVATQPWRSHTVEEKKAKGVRPIYFNNHTNHYNALDVGRQVTYRDMRSLDERIEDAIYYVLCQALSLVFLQHYIVVITNYSIYLLFLQGFNFFTVKTIR